jgi:hypothetical protein
MPLKTDWTTNFANVKADERLSLLCTGLAQQTIPLDGPQGLKAFAADVCRERQTAEDEAFSQSAPIQKRDRILARIDRTNEGRTAAVARREKSEADLQTALAADDDAAVTNGRAALTAAIAEVNAFDRELQILDSLRRAAEQDASRAREVSLAEGRQRIIDEMQQRAGRARVAILAALRVPSVEAAIAEWATATYILSLPVMGGNLNLGQLANFAAMPPERAPGVPADGERSSNNAKGPTLISVG